jgi:hypothetical protein
VANLCGSLNYSNFKETGKLSLFSQAACTYGFGLRDQRKLSSGKEEIDGG